ncbi:MAG TPA: LPS export ABC transporter periplasmic protein LptC [Stellaceae bacterium]|nr:LPS export ABC transporter periplasmic protein LptC [Stellaceae bacterium]
MQPDSSHSRRVALLKRVLPAIGLSLMLLVAVWPRLAPLLERMRFAFPAIDPREARELRMLNPRYLGTDRENRPFVVTAAVGQQVPDNNDLMSLEEPKADMKAHDGASVVVTAATGIYQSQGQILDLFGNVTLVHENGTRITTETARFNVADNSGHGDDPVEGHGPTGDIKAQGFRFYNKGDTLIFTGRSDLVLKGAHPNPAAAPPPPAVPPKIAEQAAAVEAAARPELAAAAKEEAAKKAAAHPARHHPPPRHHAAAAHHPARPAHHAPPKKAGPA